MARQRASDKARKSTHNEEIAQLLDQLQRERAFLQDVLEHLPAAVGAIAVGPEHTVSYANQQFQSVFGESVGKKANELFDVRLESGDRKSTRLNSSHAD